MRVMGIPGLTLYHLKSHLQKYRLGKNHEQSEACSDLKPDDVYYRESPSMDVLNLFSDEKEINDPTQEQINENVRIAQAIKMQMEVQRKLYEQIEVQRDLQLRIEAQGKYLQKVLKKAQETLSSYNCSTAGVEVEHAKAELSQLVAMVSSSSFSGLTDATDLSLDNLEEKHVMRYTCCSVESSLTSSECSERREEESDQGSQENCVLILPLLVEPRTRGLNSRKRSRNSASERNWKQTGSKKSQGNGEEMGQGLRKFGLLETIDLNCLCENDLDVGPMQPIDLNSKK